MTHYANRTAGIYADPKQASLDYLVDTLNVMVPFRMVEIDRLARRIAANVHAPARDEYARQVRLLGQRVDPRYLRTKTTGEVRDLVNRVTGAPIASTNVGIVATQGDALFGESKPGTGETITAALATLVAAGALTSPVGVSFHDGHWCRGKCKAKEHR